jgi:hypothetical protein
MPVPIPINAQQRPKSIACSLASPRRSADRWPFRWPSIDGRHSAQAAAQRCREKPAGMGAANTTEADRPAAVDASFNPDFTRGAPAL